MQKTSTFDRKRFLSQNSIWLVLIGLIAIVSIAQPKFLSVTNMITLVQGEAVRHARHVVLGRDAEDLPLLLRLPSGAGQKMSGQVSRMGREVLIQEGQDLLDPQFLLGPLDLPA